MTQIVIIIVCGIAWAFWVGWLRSKFDQPMLADHLATALGMMVLIFAAGGN